MKHKNMKSFFFVTDLDNTLVGDDYALKILNQQLASHREKFGTKIVYATGRSLYLYRLLAKYKRLLTPDALITSVGTEMYFYPETETFDSEWASILSKDWNREEIVAITSKYKEIQFQPESEQNPFKISYYLAESVADEILAKLKADLQQQGYNIRLIYSAGQDLDLLPQHGNKGLAVKFLRARWDIAAQDTITCGDSGNDVALFEGEEKGIIVGNAKPELLEWYKQNKNESVYLAKASCAGGILEGLEYFKFF